MKKIFTLLVLTIGFSINAQVGATDKTYTVNTFYAELGGFVIKVRDDGKHGLVVAMQDQGRTSWWQASDLMVGFYANHDTDGAKFMDWRLPTIRELNLMWGVYKNGNGANLNNNVHYWSSEVDETNEDNAYYVVFMDNVWGGTQRRTRKSVGNDVRSVRDF